VEAFYGQQRVAVHAYSAIKGGFSTLPEHMPASHRAHREWTPAKLIAWGERIGLSTAAVVTWQMAHRPHPEQGFRACLGIVRLVKGFGRERVEAACSRALDIGARTYGSVRSILDNRLDQAPAPRQARDDRTITHPNIRGSRYYH
jgi:transposase